MRPGYVVRSALQGMARTYSLSATSTATLAVGLWLVGLCLVALSTGQSFLQAYAQGGHLTCGIADSVPERDWAALAGEVQRLPGVAAARVVTPGEGLALLQQDGALGAGLAVGVTAALVPASLTIQPKASLLDEHGMAALAKQIGAIAGLEDVEYGAVPLERTRRLLESSARFALALAAALSVALIIMVMNTIRLMVHSRQDELQILQLIGATPAFVRAPFLLEGLLCGLLAGALAGGLAGCCEHLLADALASFSELLGLTTTVRLFAWPLFALQLAIGATLGLVGSALAVGGFVRQELGDDL